MSDLDDATRLSGIFHGDGQAIAVLAMEHASILQQFVQAVALSHPAPSRRAVAAYCPG